MDIFDFFDNFEESDGGYEEEYVEVFEDAFGFQHVHRRTLHRSQPGRNHQHNFGFQRRGQSSVLPWWIEVILVIFTVLIQVVLSFPSLFLAITLLVYWNGLLEEDENVHQAGGNIARRPHID